MCSYSHYITLQDTATRGIRSLLIVLDNGSPESAVLESFYPPTVDRAKIPSGVPDGILAEFREAELCASFGANRAASALFRSVLEKVLKENGYTDSNLGNLQKRIDAAAGDGLITEARRKQAHENVRSLGNDVLHDDWREITDEEVQDAYRYSRRCHQEARRRSRQAVQSWEAAIEDVHQANERWRHDRSVARGTDVAADRGKAGRNSDNRDC